MARSAECSLCGLPVIGRPVKADGQVFCCEGCSRVDAVARSAGIRVSGHATPRADAASRKSAALAAIGARRDVYRIDGMWCASCSLVLTDALLDLPGVLDAEISYAASLARVTRDPEAVSSQDIVDRIGLLGYRAEKTDVLATGNRDGDDVFLRLFVSIAVGMWVDWPTWLAVWPQAMRHGWGGERPLELFTAAAALVVMLYGGWPFLKGAIGAARVRRVTMDTLVVIGTWTAWLYSAFVLWRSPGAATYFDSASMITTIVLLGRWIESLSGKGASEALTRMTAQPLPAWRIPEGGSAGEAERLEASELVVGDLIVVRAGEQVPADGVVVEGDSDIDASRMTGEAMPVHAGPGDEVLSGTLNLADAITVRVTRPEADTLYGRLAGLAEDAVFAKSTVQRLSDVAASLFTPIVLAIAAVTLLSSLATGVGIADGIYRAVAVLVVACPCALGLAAPLALSNAISEAARAGALLRGGPSLERIAEIETVAFDKTGTVTSGLPRFSAIVGGGERDRMLRLAAALEATDSHPLANAVLSATPYAGAQVPVAAGVKRVPGMGLTGEVDGRRVLLGSERLLAAEGLAAGAEWRDEAERLRRLGGLVVWLADEDEVLGGLAFEDALRPEALDLLPRLHSAGYETAMISGDARLTCEAVASRLGVDKVFAETSPHEKEQVIRDLAEKGAVAYVGDGVNDVAALAAADLGVALSAGSDVAVDVADVVLLGENDVQGRSSLDRLADLLCLANRTRRVMRQNLMWAFTYNLIALPLAASGRLSPVIAAAAMAVSSLAVVLNSMRLRTGGNAAKMRKVNLAPGPASSR